MCNILTWLCQLHLIWIYQVWVYWQLPIIYQDIIDSFFFSLPQTEKVREKSFRKYGGSLIFATWTISELYLSTWQPCQLSVASLLICKLKHIKSLNIYIKILAFHLQIMQDLVFFYDRWSKDWNWLKKN